MGRRCQGGSSKAAVDAVVVAADAPDGDVEPAAFKKKQQIKKM